MERHNCRIARQVLHLLSALVAGLLLVSCQRTSPTTRAEQESYPPGVAVGSHFPLLQFEDLNGNPVDISSLKGKVVLVDFWATWCPPCRHEVPLLVSTYEKRHADGLEIVGISLDKDKSALLEFIKQKGVVWPQYFDGKGWDNNISRRFGVKSIPDTILLDRQGVIRHRALRGADLETAIDRLLSDDN